MNAVMNKHARDALQANRGKCDSWSLYFDKFSGYSTKKEPILKKVITHYNDRKSQVLLQTVIEKRYVQFQQLATTRKMRFIFLSNRSRLLVNMGHSCVLENVGFSFEHITGLPYVPGTALKGVVSNWAMWEANGDAAFEDDLPNFESNRAKVDPKIIDIFGANEGDAEQGKINFYGIFPLKVPSLEIDILTPHGRKVIPNHFLTVGTGTIWMIPIALNRGPESLLDEVERLIEEALKNYGVGAKTASGYGKFETPIKDKLDQLTQSLTAVAERHKQQEKEAQRKQKLLAEKEKQEAEEKARFEALSPEEQTFKIYLHGIRDESDFKGRLGKLAELEEQEQRNLLTLLKTTYAEVLKPVQKDFSKGERKGKKAYKRAKAIMDVASKLGVEL